MLGFPSYWIILVQSNTHPAPKGRKPQKTEQRPNSGSHWDDSVGKALRTEDLSLILGTHRLNKKTIPSSCHPTSLPAKLSSGLHTCPMACTSTCCPQINKLTFKIIRNLFYEEGDILHQKAQASAIQLRRKVTPFCKRDKVVLTLSSREESEKKWNANKL